MTAERELHFDEHEIAAVKKCPEALRWIADYHHAEAASFDAIGEPCFNRCVRFHEIRAKELETLADEAQLRIDAGDA